MCSAAAAGTCADASHMHLREADHEALLDRLLVVRHRVLLYSAWQACCLFARDSQAKLSNQK
jgi:hypothetical protein